MKSLPKILDHLTERTLRDTTFLRPIKGKNITVRHMPEAESSQKTQIFSVRELRFPMNTVIPVHVHQRKEKLYWNLQGGHVQILIFDPQKPREKPERHALVRGGEAVVVQAGRPHAIIYTVGGECTLRVITAPQDDADIEWEKDIDTLLLNKHREQD